jgi:outer membrane receptor protein involved in Fe transport
MRHATVLFLCLLLLAAHVVYAGNTGKIAGDVKDSQTGEALVGANIVLEGTTMGAATNIDGRYVILNVPPGKYALIASAVGYNRKSVTNVTVNIDLTTTIDFSLSSTVLDVGEEVVITAQRPLVQKDQTAKTAVVGGEQIAALPVTEVGQVLNLQAGFVAGSLRGGRSGEVAYWIDGVPVTDGYNGSQVVEVNKNLVQELQVVSGAFNAEYGQAMSGIVNIATKEGGTKLTGGLGVYGGQYVTTTSDTLFPGLNSFTPTSIRNIEANLSGPILQEDLTFFANGRYYHTDGWLRGYRRFNPWNISYTDDITRTFYLYRDASGKGDSSMVNMNATDRYYGQGKLTWRIAPTMKLNTNYIYDQSTYRSYDQLTSRRQYYYNPDGYGTDYNTSHTVILQFSHTLNPTTFYTVGVSWFDRQFKHYLYDKQYAPSTDGSGDLWEVQDGATPSYVHPKLLLTDDAYSFYTGGMDLNRFRRETITKLLKFDLSSQIDNYNLVKVGAEYRTNNVFYENIDLQPMQDQSDINLATASPFIRTRILPLSALSHNMYNHSPLELAAYIQDKLEFKNFILNIGLRFDYFEPDGYVLNDPPDPNDPTYTVDDPNIYAPIKPANREKSLEERHTYWYRDATPKWQVSPRIGGSPKWQVSPRIGGSFPITAAGMVYFSYGHFFQIPRFERLYENPDFKIGFGTGNQGVVGNTDLEPEQTINAEIGVQQQLSDDISVDLTAYMRDIRNLTGTRSEEIVVFGGSAKYSKYTNSDFGFIKGIVLTLNKRFGGGFAATVDYTYQVAKGSASDPQEARNAVAGGALPEVQLTPLGWDQRHTLNVTASYSAQEWGVSVIGQYGSGSPYTPRRNEDITTLLNNSQIKPSYTNVDLRAFYEFRYDMLRFVVFARVFNLLDMRNEPSVYDDTGRAGFTTDEARVAATGVRERVNTLHQWYRQPAFFSEPRRIELGMNVEF